MSEGILEMEDSLRRANNMKNWLVIAESTYTSWIVIVCLSVYWHYRIEKEVPRPYLLGKVLLIAEKDEFFHVQQAELYLRGRFTEWHPKITTPPGLYLVSLFYLGVLSVTRIIDYVNVADLRRTNLWAAGLIPFHVWFVLSKLVTSYDGFKADEIALPFAWSMIELNHAILNICLFPPLFFFYGLYYTDVWSVLAVLTTIQFRQRRWWRLMVAAGIASFFFRQTNIFWVAIYLGGSEIVSRLDRGSGSGSVKPSVRTLVVTSWQHSYVYDPLVSQASFEDYVTFTMSLVAVSVAQISKLLPHVKYYLQILSAFGFFVLWNEGVVLGDKENHVASLHLAQMLYIWPYIMFFSFPLLYPYILNAIIPQELLPSGLRTGSTRHQLPRLIVALPILFIMLLIVHFNTIIHPFTLADNRHYTFYVFRILLYHPAIKYLVVPIYFICAWAAITALGGLPNVQTPIACTPIPRLQPVRRGEQVRLPPSNAKYAELAFRRGRHVSFAMIWLVATSLSLVTAPLVEPRYFIIPWLVWRLHLASPWPTGEEASKKRRKKARGFRKRLRAVFWEKHDHRLWLETVWFLVVNWGVGYVFLYWGFEWPQEKGKVQRFMW
ncbi:MAG: hypothetical protein Q9170_005950 [Blastenia crenularia]